MAKSDKKKELNKLLKSLEKDYNVRRASDIKEEPKLRTGLYALDVVLDGGIAQCIGGHRIELFGSESTGKSTFALHIVKKYQELDKTCVIIDGENSFDKNWAEVIGVNTDELLVLNPDNLEQLGDLFVKLIPQSDLIVIDSIVSLIPSDEIDRDTGEPTMALAARVNALITRKIYKAIAKEKTTLLFINQLREKVGVMYGNPHTTGGGRALKHLYNTRIEFKTGKPIDVGSGDKKERIGIEIKLKGIKNKKGKPYKSSVVDFYFNGLIDNKKSLFFSAVKYGIISRSGAWYEYGNIKITGKENMMKELKETDYIKIEKEIWERTK
jgi:recombination protein RecA